MLLVVDLRPVQPGQLQLVAPRLRLDYLRVVPVGQQDLRWATWLDGLQRGWMISLTSSTQWVLCLEIQLITIFDIELILHRLTLWRLWGIFPIWWRDMLSKCVVTLVAP